MVRLQRTRAASARKWAPLPGPHCAGSGCPSVPPGGGIPTGPTGHLGLIAGWCRQDSSRDPRSPRSLEPLSPVFWGAWAREHWGHRNSTSSPASLSLFLSHSASLRTECSRPGEAELGQVAMLPSAITVMRGPGVTESCCIPEGQLESLGVRRAWWGRGFVSCKGRKGPQCCARQL